jgi:putative spermidine/putrescine transport system ATP-binding protein
MSSGQRVLVSIRPERIEFDAQEQQSINLNRLSCRIADSVYQGDHLRIQLDESAYQLVVRADRRGFERLQGTETVACFSPSDCWLITI